MNHFFDQSDRAYLSSLKEHAAPQFEAFAAMNASVFDRPDGAISQLNRELIAIAVAVSKQCAYCIQSHTKNAAGLGASEAEIAETIMVAVAIGAGSAATHGALALKLFDAANLALYAEHQGS